MINFEWTITRKAVNTTILISIFDKFSNFFIYIYSFHKYPKEPKIGLVIR